MAQLVAHHTGSVGVRGSSPLSSTKENPRPNRLGFLLGGIRLGRLIRGSSPLSPTRNVTGIFPGLSGADSDSGQGGWCDAPNHWICKLRPW